MSELKDYDKLEWFDCQKNFPPMRTDLYIDSEHGFGIGRLGKRVKDGSIIWTVHLDSGKVYLVYAFYKVKRWAYMPKDEKTNTKFKNELMLNKDRSCVPCYPQIESDKVIAEKDMEIFNLKEELSYIKADSTFDRDKHKKLLESKDKEIQRLENLCESYRIDCDNIAIREANAYKEIERDNKRIRYQKYKRCLAMASYWVAVSYQCVDDKHRQSAVRHRRKWLELANKFNEARR